MDVDSDTRIFKKDDGGFRSFILGNVALPGFDEFIAEDISFTATMLGGETIDDISLEILPDFGETSVFYDPQTGAVRMDTNLQLESFQLSSHR